LRRLTESIRNSQDAITNAVARQQQDSRGTSERILLMARNVAGQVRNLADSTRKDGQA
jgi:hypothetical protein